MRARQSTSTLLDPIGDAVQQIDELMGLEGDAEDALRRTESAIAESLARLTDLTEAAKRAAQRRAETLIGIGDKEKAEADLRAAQQEAHLVWTELEALRAMLPTYQERFDQVHRAFDRSALAVKRAAYAALSDERDEVMEALRGLRDKVVRLHQLPGSSPFGGDPVGIPGWPALDEAIGRLASVLTAGVRE